MAWGSRLKVNMAKVAGNTAVLEALLEVLNEQLDRYVPKGDIEREFKEKIDPRNKIDPTFLHGSLENALGAAEGLPILSPNGLDLAEGWERRRHEDLANSAQILQTKLIERMRLPIKNSNGETVEQDCYKITLRGLEELNAIKLHKAINRFRESNESSDFIIAVLTFVLAAVGIVQVMDIINPKGVAASGYTVGVLFGLVGIFGIIGIGIFVKYVILGVFFRMFSRRGTD